MHSDKKEEYARIIDLKYAWDTGAPLPQVFSNGLQTFLIYKIVESDSEICSSNIIGFDNKADINYPLALVEFIEPDTHRFGIANDEVAIGHPLFNKGLVVYSFHIIENSTWIEELKKIHRSHPYFDEKKWANKKHFLFYFHDEIFEVIAKDFQIETFNTTFFGLSSEVVKRINT